LPARILSALSDDEDTLSIPLKRRTVAKLKLQGAKLDMGAALLAAVLIETIANDDLYEAVLDLE
jgi:hypothetical protein